MKISLQSSELNVKKNEYRKSTLVWFGLCCLVTPGLSKDIRCHI